MSSRHVSATRIGGTDVLTVTTRDVGEPGPGQVRVRVAAAGVSFGDVLLRTGVIPGGPKPPFTPGYDVTGAVDAVGEGVTSVQPGQRVTALLRHGGYADHVVVPAERAVPLPDGVDTVEAAATALNYFVAQQMLHRVARVEGGQTVLVLGAAGGVGTALLQLGALAGLELYGAASPHKHDQVSVLGARPVDYHTTDLVALMRDTPAQGAHVVLDPVGGSSWRRSYRAVRRGGVLVGYGQSEALVDGKADRVAAVGGFLRGMVLPKLRPDGRRAVFYHAWSLEKKAPTAYRDDLGAVLGLLAAGKVKPVVARTLPLEQAGEAHELLERRAVTGKIVLTCGTD